MKFNVNCIEDIKRVNLKELEDNKIYYLSHVLATYIGFYKKSQNLFCFYSLGADFCNVVKIESGYEVEFDLAMPLKSITIEV